MRVKSWQESKCFYYIPNRMTAFLLTWKWRNRLGLCLTEQLKWRPTTQFHAGLCSLSNSFLIWSAMSISLLYCSMALFAQSTASWIICSGITASFMITLYGPRNCSWMESLAAGTASQRLESWWWPACMTAVCRRRGGWNVIRVCCLIGKIVVLVVNLLQSRCRWNDYEKSWTVISTGSLSLW